MKKISNLLNTIIRIIKNRIIIICLIILYIILYNLNFKYFPDLLGFSKIELLGYYNLIIATTSIFFSILIAVVLLVFQLTKNRNLRRDDSRAIFNHWSTNLIIDFSVFIIIASLLSSTQIGNSQTNIHLNIAYFITYIFLIYIILLVPFLKLFLNQTDSLKETLKKINEIKLELFTNIYPTVDHKLIRIFDEIILAIREGDYVFYTKALSHFSNKVNAFIDKGIDKEIQNKILFQYTNLLNMTIVEAKKQNDIQYLNLIWENINIIYYYAAVNKIKLFHYGHLKFFINEYIKILFIDNNINCLSKGINTIMEIIKLQLKENCPKQEDVTHLRKTYEKNFNLPDNYDGIEGWNHIFELIFMLDSIQRNSIEYQNKLLFDKCGSKFNNLIDEIKYGYFDNLGEFQKDAMISSLLSFKYQLTEKVLYLNWFEKLCHIFLIDSDLICKFIDTKSIDTYTFILNRISDLLIKSQRIDKLDEPSIRDWATIARLLIYNYKSNDEVNKVVMFIINTYSKLKEDLEDKQNKCYENYIAIRENLESIKEFLLKYNKKKNVQLNNEIDNLLKSFKNIDNTSKEYKIVEWS